MKTDTQTKDDCVMMVAEIGVMWLQVKKCKYCWHPLEAGRESMAACWNLDFGLLSS
jgi:hypothetical protein